MCVWHQRWRGGGAHHQHHSAAHDTTPAPQRHSATAPHGSTSQHRHKRRQQIGTDTTQYCTHHRHRLPTQPRFQCRLHILRYAAIPVAITVATPVATPVTTSVPTRCATLATTPIATSARHNCHLKNNTDRREWRRVCECACIVASVRLHTLQCNRAHVKQGRTRGGKAGNRTNGVARRRGGEAARRRAGD